MLPLGDPADPDGIAFSVPIQVQKALALALVLAFR